MKEEIHITNKSQLCKNCFNLRRENSAYCGDCSGERIKIYVSDDKFPMLAKVKKHFKINDGVVFTLGDTIYMKNKKNLTPDLLTHEITHIVQQSKIGKDKWWDRYIKDKEFRLEQELEAYHRQYIAYKRNTIGMYSVSELFLDIIAKDLSSSLYGNIISFKLARKQIIC